LTRTIVHAGFHKTGTTTIQDGLRDHADWLAAQGIHYPDDPSGLGGHPGLACWLSRARAGGEPGDLFHADREAFAGSRGFRSMPEETYAAACATDLPVRLVSSEVFDTFDAAELDRFEAFLAPIDRVVVYYRGGIRFLYACWSTKVRWTGTQPFDDFLREAWARRPATPITAQISQIEALVDRFGEDRVSVRSFDAARSHPRGLIGDFVEGELGLPPIEPFKAKPAANVTPPLMVIEVLRALNLAVGFGKATADARGRFYRAMPTMQGPVPDALAERLAPVVRAVSIADIAASPPRADGRVDLPDTPAARLLSDWRFPAEETAQYIPTGALMQALSGSALFQGLVG
jgi:hypothetical protein